MSFGALVEHFDVCIPSDTSAGAEVQERIISSLESLQYTPRDVFGIRLALEEALVNAIKHGNQLDPCKTVRVLAWISSEKVRVEIEDQGEGFRIEEVPDPTADENLDRPCGRGIMLMRAFMSLIEYNNIGNRVVLEKVRSTDDSDEAAAEG